jgi:hypothetical protein
VAVKVSITTQTGQQIVVHHANWVEFSNDGMPSVSYGITGPEVEDSECWKYDRPRLIVIEALNG